MRILAKKIAVVAALALSATLSIEARPLAEKSSPHETLVGQAAELGLDRDGFEAFRRLQFEGDAFYSKTEDNLQSLHRRAYRDISSVYAGDRLTAEQANALLDRLISIGQANLEAPENPEEVTTATFGELEQLVSDVADIMTDRANPKLMTPEIDRLLWLMEAVTRYAEGGSLSESGVSRLRRELERQIFEEERAKRDDSLSDRERLDLMDATLRTWLGFVRSFRRG